MTSYVYIVFFIIILLLRSWYNTSCIKSIHGMFMLKVFLKSIAHKNIEDKKVLHIKGYCTVEHYIGT